MVDQNKVVCNLSNSTVFNDTQQPQTQF